MRLAIDTNAYVAVCKGSPHAIAVMRRATAILVPFVVVAELRAGFACGTRTTRNEQMLTRFLNTERVGILYADDQTSHHYARLYYQLRRQGTPIPANDLWIAALVSQHTLTLLSTDRHFTHLPQLPLVREPR
ncbi:MAG: type II toxin-antitoxin system VapC family toxin [Deltaproteobacteria bacterium]|nr:type II toxin-antitoxin system VapC family toxin [Deltaproteobacteria bacterium]